MSDTTVDEFYDGRVKVVQPARGFRAGTDSLLLSSALPSDFAGAALDVGCGCGGALLTAAYRMPKAQLTGIDIDPDMIALANQGIAENVGEDRITADCRNADALPPDWQNRFDLVFSNPPFFESGTIQQPGEGKAAAYLESLSLKDWIHAMLFALRPKGRFIMIHRAADLARILAVIERQGGEITVRPIHSYPGAEAKRVLVSARKGLRSGPMRLLEPRYLYREKGGTRTDWALAMQRDGAGMDWN